MSQGENVKVLFEGNGWKELSLPGDYDMLYGFIERIIDEDAEAVVALDYMDLTDACRLDAENRTCIEGQLALMEAACGKDDFSEALELVSDYRKSLEGAVCGAVLHVTSPADGTNAVGMTEVSGLAEAFSDAIGLEGIQIAFDIDDTVGDCVRIRAILRTV